MKKLLTLALLAALLAFAGCSPYHTSNNVVEASAVAQLTTAEGEGFCTAFHVGNGVWVSAGHCVGWTDGDVLIHGQVAAVTHAPGLLFDTADISVWQGPAGYPYFELGALPEFGDPIHYIGYPWYGEKYHYGVYAGYWGSEDKEDGTYEVTLFADGGASGSPIIDSQGDAVGILVSGFRGRPYVYCESVDTLRKILD